MRGEPCRASVVIPVYNSAPTLRRAVESVRRQSLESWELLIVDDGSTDGAAEIARSIAGAEPRARVITLGTNRGKPHAMNRACSEARGEWIAVLDADDEYHPRRLERLLEAAEAMQADVVADNQTIYDAGANCVVGRALPNESTARMLPAAEFIARCDPYAAFDYGMLKPMVRTAFLRASGTRYREAARLSEDFLFLTELYAAGARVALVPEPLYVWTQAFGSISRRWTSTGGGAWRYDFASAVRAHLAVRQEFVARREMAFARLLARRARAFRRLAVLSEVSRSRAAGAAPVKIAALLLRHPTAWPAVGRRLAQRAAERAAARPPSRFRHRTTAAGAD